MMEQTWSQILHKQQLYDCQYYKLLGQPRGGVKFPPLDYKTGEKLVCKLLNQLYQKQTH